MYYYRIAGNFRLEKIFAFFAQACRGRNFFGELFYPVKNLSHWNFYTWLSSSTSSASWSSISCFTWYSKPLETSFSICSLAWCRYCRTSTVHLGFARSCRTPIVGAIAFRHPDEQPALWAKLNSAKFLCQYKVWALSEILSSENFVLYGIEQPQSISNSIAHVCERRRHHQCLHNNLI